MSQDSGEPSKRTSELRDAAKVFALTGLVFVAGSVLAGLFIFPALQRSAKESQGSLEETSLKAAASGLLLYAEEHEGFFPPAGRWKEAVRPLLSSPEALLVSRPGESIALFAGAAGQSLHRESHPEKRPLVFESSLSGSSPSGGLPALAKRPDAKAVNWSGGVAGHALSLDWSEARR